MLNGMTAIDRKWLTRIILKKLNLKFGRARILQIYHKNAEAAFHQCGSLSRMCAIIENNEPIESVDIITPFYVIWPMLCERMNIENLQKIISENDYYLETKMDGERCQIHIRGNEFRYFSRNCNDFTTPYGSDPSGGNFTPVLAKLIAQNVESVILDGEMMVWDREEQAYHTKCNACPFFQNTNEIEMNVLPLFSHTYSRICECSRPSSHGSEIKFVFLCLRYSVLE